ncbi:hypothetical protein ABT301_29645 [Streptomyces sp. NPDC000987]|uniref:hypothetical protein n=1 Tax=Streptomyces sp. NPDC000987 TaxID=3154374 RepID=UPI0033271F53
MENGERCIAKHYAKGMCNAHYKRAAQYGNPTARVNQPSGQILKELRAAAYATTDDCLFLSAYDRPTTVLIDGRYTGAARHVWIMRHGDPGDLYVLHNCNGGSGSHGCINIRHLRIGTHQENMRDMAGNGRSTMGRPSNRGEEHGNHKLAEDDVREIRRLIAEKVSYQVIADRFRVSQSNIGMIATGRTWGWLL